MARRRATILTPTPGAVPLRDRLQHKVEKVSAVALAGPSGWDDDDPPDETVLHFTAGDLTRIEEARPGDNVQIRLGDHQQLRDRELRRAVRRSLDRGVNVRIRVEG